MPNDDDPRFIFHSHIRVGFLDFGFTGPNRSKRVPPENKRPKFPPPQTDSLTDVHQLTGNVLFTDFGAVKDPRNTSKTLNTDLKGRLLMYESETNRVTVLLKNLSGPAGVAVSQDGAYVLVSNFIGNNTIRYWLRGPRANTYESINFQERPDNIRRTVVGDFWRATTMVKQPAQSVVPIGQRMDGFGRVSRTINLEAWYGNQLISEVHEFGGELYLGSRFTTFVGVYRF
ncbi:hypothetical protein GQ457_17G017750 [Hibiscus cannabinus]